jgi:methionyl-tRNA synthetase
MIAIQAQPFIPSSAGKLLDYLSVAGTARNFTDIENSEGLVPQTLLQFPAPIFPRYIEAVPEVPSS